MWNSPNTIATVVDAKGIDDDRRRDQDLAHFDFLGGPIDRRHLGHHPMQSPRPERITQGKITQGPLGAGVNDRKQPATPPTRVARVIKPGTDRSPWILVELARTSVLTPREMAT